MHNTAEKAIANKIAEVLTEKHGLFCERRTKLDLSTDGHGYEVYEAIDIYFVEPEIITSPEIEVIFKKTIQITKVNNNKAITLEDFMLPVYDTQKKINLEYETLNIEEAVKTIAGILKP